MVVELTMTAPHKAHAIGPEISMSQVEASMSIEANSLVGAGSFRNDDTMIVVIKLVRCDYPGCGKESDYIASTENGARHIARQHKWSCGKIDLCPAHRKIAIETLAQPA